MIIIYEFYCFSILFKGLSSILQECFENDTLILILV